ncbi:lipase family protein [Edaphobacter flagellatus]|uniref:lipase family protein n=1 Tax=Edaphobacter flagellatus TaxID=1933044 RepID=UPI0021B2486E|nr:lipase family protein [Edaphobacter flagellatus]
MSLSRGLTILIQPRVHVMNVPVADLRYAKDIAIPIIDVVYTRYGGGSASVPGIIPLGDIHADTGAMHALAETTDLRTRVLLKAAFADGTLFGTIDKDEATRTGFIAFRGTKSFTEWIDDVLFEPVTFSEVGAQAPRVHAGFHKVYLLARQSLMDQLHLLSGIDRLIVTGHSLGAAVASLCALDLAVHGGFHNLCCWTFASPRTYFLSASAFNQKITQSLRVANPVDIVTHVPSIVQGYVHVTGGFDIDPKIEDFHSLDLTYAPGIAKKIGSMTAHAISLTGSEDEELRSMFQMATPS